MEKNELKCLSELDSPHILKVHKVIRRFDKTFIILEYCEKNLRKELDHCQYELSKVLVFFEEIVAGMHVLQENNILHRDLKFENILLRGGRVKLADFGLAKFMGLELEVESRRCGTPYTMAP